MSKIEKRDKKIRKKSSCWLFYTKKDRGGVCKLCQKTIISNGNTTNLLNHLKRKHTIQWEAATGENEDDLLDDSGDTQMEFEMEDDESIELHRSTKEAHEQGLAYQSSDGRTVIWLHPDVQLDQLSSALQPQIALIEHASSDNSEATVDASEDKDGTILGIGNLKQKEEDTTSSDEVVQKADTTDKDHSLVTYAMVLNNGEVIEQDDINAGNIAQIVTVSSSEDPSTVDNPVSSSPSNIVLANLITSHESKVTSDNLKTSPSKIILGNMNTNPSNLMQGNHTKTPSLPKRTVVVTRCTPSFNARPIQPKPEWVPIKMFGQTPMNSVAVNKSSVQGNASILNNSSGCGGQNSASNCGGQNSAGHCGGQNSAGHCGGQNSAGHCGGQNSAGHCGGQNSAGHCGRQNSAGHCGGQNSAGHCGGQNSAGNCGGQSSASSCGAQREDSFDHFGKYIAALLRNMPSKKSASRLQKEMLNWVLKEQMLYED